MADIPRVVPGEKIKASTMNSLIDSIPDLATKGMVSLTKSGAKWNLDVPEQVNFQRKGQVFRQPFDLSTNNCLSDASELSIQVVRAHLPNAKGGLDDISVIGPMKFPAQSEVSVWLCELSSELSDETVGELASESSSQTDESASQKVVRSSQDSELDNVVSSRLLWRILSNGVVAEDFRWSSLQESGPLCSKVLLDLSSLNWTSVSSQVSAQTWHYDKLLSDDLVNILYVATPPQPPQPDPDPTSDELSVCVDKWRFLVRPEDGGTLHYASLSAMLSDMDCQISATPLGVLSNNLSNEPWLSGQGLAEGDETLQNHFVCVAKYKNTGQTWDEADKIWAPNWWYLKQSLDQTPFWLDIRDSSHMFIRNCWLYVGRTFIDMADTQVNGRATYYVEINTQLPNQPTATIHRVGGQQFPAGRPNNTDTLTYYPLWYLPSTVDYRDPLQTPVDLRGIWKLPFYSL